MPLYPVTLPSQAVVSLDDMKKHLNVDWTDDDDYITALTEAATQHLDGRDGRLGRALASQTWDYALDRFLCQGRYQSWGNYGWRQTSSRIEIPLAPLISVESVTYFDTDNVQQTVNPSTYTVLGIGGGGLGCIALNRGSVWPGIFCRPEGVVIRFTAGYLNTGDSPPSGSVPGPIIAAIKLFTATLYENRQNIVIGETVLEMPWAAEALIRPYRIFSH